MQGNQAIYGGAHHLGQQTVNTRDQAKSAVLYRQEPRFELLTTGRIHQGELTFLEQHLIRLRGQAYFTILFDEPKLLNNLRRARHVDSKPLTNNAVLLPCRKTKLPIDDHRADRLAVSYPRPN